tara:strand:- start:53 stop:631 length:579 start_codon:yes stop_codon:yes gene_type:complete
MGIVYMLSYGDMTYIGSTIRTMNNRMSSHKNQYKRWLEGKSYYCSSFDIIKNENYELLIIEEVKKETEEECREREQWWIEFYGKDNLVNKRNSNGWNLKYNKIYQKIYRNQNKEIIKQQQKQNYLENKDIILQQRKEYHLTNKEKIKEKIKEYRLTNKERIKEYKKEYQLTNKEKIKEYKKQYYLKNKLQKD